MDHTVIQSQVKSNPQQYPRWITLPGGQSIIVQNHAIHSAMMGQEYDADANLVVPEPPPALPSEPAAPLAPEPAPLDPPPALDSPPVDSGESEAEEDLSELFKKNKAEG